jgi:hypothetical protein
VNRRNAKRLAVLGLLVPAACGSEPGPGTPAVQIADAVAVDPPVINEPFGDRQIFPYDNWWNLSVVGAPLDPDSEAIIAWIGETRPLHPDFGPPPYGIPYVGVGEDQPLVPVTFVLYGDESDPGAPGHPPGYPIPDEAYLFPNYIEGGTAGGGPSGDRHLLVVDRDRWLLFELWATQWNAALSRWEAGSGAVFDLSANDRRPEGWTSADAAGLAVFPGLVKYDETEDPAGVRHALRFTVRATDGHVWPASHTAGSTAGAPPLGTRLRLKMDVDIAGHPPEVRRIFQAMKLYGLILADNGSDMYIQGTMDPRWDNDILNPAFESLTAADFEVVQRGWNPQVTGVPR